MYKKSYRSRRIRGKLLVCRYLLESNELREHVPYTLRLSLSNAEQMLGRYGAVFVKPDVGSLGIGIMKLARAEEGYELTETRNRRQTTRSYSTFEAMYRRVREHAKKDMIVQQAIELDQVQGKPYDIRVMVQRKPGGDWTCNGFLVKVGAPNKIVTNYYQGGKIYTLKKLCGRLGLSDMDLKDLEDRLTAKSLKIAKTLSVKQAGMHELGIDFALDNNDRLWVLEVNSNHPQFHPLKKLDLPSYNRMRQFAASYGRKDD